MTIVEFITARLAEHEALAKAATGRSWSVDNPNYPESILDEESIAVVAGGRWGGEASVFNEGEDAIHIAANDPAFVLGWIVAMRKIIALHAPVEWHGNIACSACTPDWEAALVDPVTLLIDECPELRAIARMWATHPQYRAEWALQPNGRANA
jgi:hypothetical protein